MCKHCELIIDHEELLRILDEAEVLATLETASACLRGMNTREMDSKDLALWSSALAGVSATLVFLRNGEKLTE